MLMDRMTLESYYRPDSLCDTSWVQENLSNQNVVIFEVDYDLETAYDEGHMPNAHLVWWKKDINDAQRRDILSKQQFEKLMSRVGTTSDSELILFCLLGFRLLWPQEIKDNEWGTEKMGGRRKRVYHINSAP
jgi:3-mercaptopyruvate sulfurtransferase SseA